ncbi:MAG: cysteine desulfurase [Actinobacteria bacterium]|nr:cysteine desulfurase [Actinomycetota bacterium]
MKRIYLDYNATTPAAPEVVEAMLPYFHERFGNPSSGHWYGKQARKAVDDGRSQVAGLLKCDPGEIIFTSGGSEANNLAIKGVAWVNREKGGHVITSAVEHPAVINPCRYLEELGFRVTYVPVDEYGMVEPEQIESAICDETILISVMHANNEVGTVQPIAAIGQIARERGVLFHADAAQSAGKIPARVDELNVDMLSVASHKLYGPKGMGALYVRDGVELKPLIHGAGHESGRRAGTENTAGIAGLGKACELAERELADRMSVLTELRDSFQQMLEEELGRVVLNGHPSERLPNTLNVSLPGRNSSRLLESLPEICASTGSACHAGQEAMSPVLEAMGLAPERGLEAVRFSLGRWTTRPELEEAAKLIGKTQG